MQISRTWAAHNRVYWVLPSFMEHLTKFDWWLGCFFLLVVFSTQFQFFFSFLFLSERKDATWFYLFIQHGLFGFLLIVTLFYRVFMSLYWAETTRLMAEVTKLVPLFLRCLLSFFLAFFLSFFLSFFFALAPKQIAPSNSNTQHAKWCVFLFLIYGWLPFYFRKTRLRHLFSSAELWFQKKK